jgi:hypothetical protein
MPYTPKISDHALVRWLERIEGQDVEAIRAKIVRAIGDRLETGATRIRYQGITFRADKGVLITVIEEGK